MGVFTEIRNWFKGGKDILITNNASLFGNPFEDRYNFADVLFLNVCDILTDLINDVTLINKGKNNNMLFAEYKLFFESNGKFILNKLFIEGYCVVGYSKAGFKILSKEEYSIINVNGGNVRVVPINPEVSIYVMKSDTYSLTGSSDKSLLSGYLQYLDNLLNSSNTTTARLGALMVMTPKMPNSAPTLVELKKGDKERLESEVSENYGGLRNQKQVLIMSKPMDVSTINLSAIDSKVGDKAKMAISVICDRIKVPANQVAMLDYNSSKTLSNGSELREGDFLKYQSFERLLNSTFIQMGIEIGLNIDYTIYNKPLRNVETTEIIINKDKE